MSEPTSCCALPGSHCARTDALFNLDGVHVLDVARRGDGLELTVETGASVAGCPSCGVIATGHGRRPRRLHDIPAFGVPVRVTWLVRRWRCVEPACPRRVFTEVHDLGRPRGKLTTRAAWWALGLIQRDTASLAAAARRLGVDWHTLWDTIAPLLEGLADDPARFAGVEVLGVDEHIWHHRPRPGKGPKELTGMVDLTPVRTADGQVRTRARLLDLVGGRSGRVYADWLADAQQQRLAALFGPDEHAPVEATWLVYQRMVAAYRHPDRAVGRRLMAALITTIGNGVPAGLDEIVTLGRTLTRRAADVLAYVDRPRTSNGPTEAINGRLEHLRGAALGFRNLTHYIARALLATGGFRPHQHPGLR
jgi:transposase